MAELIIPPPLRQAHRQGLARHLDTGEGPIIGRRLELTAMHSDGSEFPVELTVTRVPLGGPPLFTGYIRDITERKLAEEQLKRSEASLAEAQRIAHLGSWEWDLRTDEVRWSDETYRIYGYAPGELAPTRDTFWRLVHPDDRQRVRSALQDALDGGKPYDIEHRIVRPDGTERVVHRQGEVVRDGAGNPVRMVGTVLDVTERSRALEQAERALELRNHFLSMASHELKTPVTLLKGYAQLLRNQADRTGDQMLRKPVRVIERQVGRIHHLVDELLDVSHVEGGRLKPEMLPFDLGVAVLEVVDEVRETTPGFAFTVHERASGLQVLGDRTRIQQVATNLLINAVKYSGGSKEVGIVFGRDEGLARFSVSDRGIGIPEEQQGRVFELYFRGANAPGSNYGGLGLGLYISKEIVEQHGGRIDMESEEGRGSTFHVSLSLAGGEPSDWGRQG
jgi:PAS domain S-box-containing protein